MAATRSPAEAILRTRFCRPVSRSTTPSRKDQRGHGNTPGVGVPGSKTNLEPPSQEEISRLAQHYWEEEGRAEGKSEEHWRRAETDLRRRAGLG